MSQATSLPKRFSIFKSSFSVNGKFIYGFLSTKVYVEKNRLVWPAWWGENLNQIFDGKQYFLLHFLSFLKSVDDMFARWLLLSDIVLALSVILCLPLSILIAVLTPTYNQNTIVEPTYLRLKQYKPEIIVPTFQHLLFHHRCVDHHRPSASFAVPTLSDKLQFPTS